MMKKTFPRYIFVLSMGVALGIAPQAFAKLNPFTINAVTKHFQKGMEVYSPTLGAAAIESGLIYNYRFNGNFTEGKNDANGNRLYTKDSSNDPVWNMVFILFPSVDGQLGTDSEAISTFAKYVNDPKTVSSLLNFSKTYRDQNWNTTNKKKFLTVWKDSVSKTLNNPSKPGKATSNKLVQSIADSIDAENDSFYPKYTTEQIITAFFYQKFNKQQDIWALLKNLDPTIVSQGELPDMNHEDVLKDPSAIMAIAHKKDPYDMDDIFILALAKLLISPTPYKGDGDLISNGNTWYFDRKEGQMIEGATFADCVEIGIRHLMNLLLFDAGSRKFNLTNIEEHVKKNTPNNLYFSYFQEFYKKQPPAAAEAGDTLTRSIFNKVVGDLNAFDKNPEINYIKGTNELNAGYINLIKVFQKVFGIQVDAIPLAGIETKRNWLKNSLEKVFNAFNPHKTYELDLSQLREENGEISGDLPIIVMDPKGNKEFSFIFSSIVGKHSQIKNLKNLTKLPGIDFDFTDTLIKQGALIQEPIEQPLWLVSKNHQLITKNVTHPFYLLFSGYIDDNKARVAFLEKIKKNFETWDFWKSPQKNIIFQGILRNILQGITWNDEVTLVYSGLSRLVLELAQKDEFKQTLYKNVRGIYSKNNDFDFIKDKFTELEVLYLENKETIRDLDLKNYQKLKTLDLKNLNIEVLTLDTLDSLESIKLSNITKIKEIVLKDLKKLKTFEIPGLGSSLGLERITLDTLNSLERMDLSHTQNLKEISLTNLGNLHDLNLSHSSVEKINGIDSINNLQTLDLSETNLGTQKINLQEFKDLKVLNLRNAVLGGIHGIDSLKNLESLSLPRNFPELPPLRAFENLKKLDLRGLKTDKVILDSLKMLEKLDMSQVNAQEIELKDLEKLKDITLGDSTVENITFNNLNALENLSQLPKTLRDFNLKNLEKLTYIGLQASKVEKITLDTLDSLKKLDLSKTDALQTLSLTNLKSLAEIGLEASSVQKITIDTLKNLDSITSGVSWLKNLKNLKVLSLKDLEKLDFLLLSGSNVEVVNLDNLKGLQSVDLSATKNLKEAYFKNLETLQTLNFTSSSVEKISLNTLKNLESINLLGINTLLRQEDFDKKVEEREKQMGKPMSEHFKKMFYTSLQNKEMNKGSNIINLKELYINDLEKLKTIDLTGSPVEKITLDNLKNLETVNLSGTKNLKETIGFENLKEGIVKH